MRNIRYPWAGHRPTVLPDHWSEPTQTIPEQSMTIQELKDRYLRGTPIVARDYDGEYDDDPSDEHYDCDTREPGFDRVSAFEALDDLSHASNTPTDSAAGATAPPQKAPAKDSLATTEKESAGTSIDDKGGA